MKNQTFSKDEQKIMLRVHVVNYNTKKSDSIRRRRRSIGTIESLSDRVVPGLSRTASILGLGASSLSSSKRVAVSDSSSDPPTGSTRVRNFSEDPSPDGTSGRQSHINSGRYIYQDREHTINEVDDTNKVDWRKKSTTTNTSSTSTTAATNLTTTQEAAKLEHLSVFKEEDASTVATEDPSDLTR
jgi:hypothetical protein